MNFLTPNIQNMKTERTSSTPFVHLELLSAKGEAEFGDESYTLVLKESYETDGTAAIITANIQHAADVCNEVAVKNLVAFPYIRFDLRQNRLNTWVYISSESIPNEIEAIKTWLTKVATDFHSKGIKVDTSDSAHPATILKIGWSSTELKI